MRSSVTNEMPRSVQEPRRLPEIAPSGNASRMTRIAPPQRIESVARICG